MRIQRRFLYPGVFFIAMGAVLVVSELYGISETVAGEALRFWPVIFIVLGIALLVRRTRVSLVGGVMAVAILGLSFGALLALGPQIATGCGGVGEPATFTTRQGTFSGPSTLDLSMRCGTLNVNSSTGSDWQVQTGNTQGVQANVVSTSTSLSVNAIDSSKFDWGRGRDVWRVTVPTANRIDQLVAQLDAGEARMELPGVQLGRADITVNAGQARFDLSGGSLQQFDATLSAGSLYVTLPDSEFAANLKVNLGEMRVCVPQDLGVRVHSDVSLGSAELPGLIDRGGYSETANYSTAARHADLSINVNLGSVKLNPAGGCQ